MKNHKQSKDRATEDPNLSEVCIWVTKLGNKHWQVKKLVEAKQYMKWVMEEVYKLWLVTILQKSVQ